MNEKKSKSAAGAPDLRSAILVMKAERQSFNNLCMYNAYASGFEDARDAAAALASAAPVEALTDEEIEFIGDKLGFQAVADKRYRENSTHGMTVSEEVEYERLHRFARAIEARIRGGVK